MGLCAELGDETFADIQTWFIIDIKSSLTRLGRITSRRGERVTESKEQEQPYKRDA
jgi:hypothetical protein